jgi:hypothetical protein
MTDREERIGKARPGEDVGGLVGAGGYSRPGSADMAHRSTEETERVVPLGGEFDLRVSIRINNEPNQAALFEQRGVLLEDGIVDAGGHLQTSLPHRASLGRENLKKSRHHVEVGPTRSLRHPDCTSVLGPKVEFDVEQAVDPSVDAILIHD